LLPEYEYFHKKHDWGNFELLVQGIEFIEKNREQLNKQEAERLITQLDAVIPDMDDFGDWDGSYALNASLSVLETLEYLVDRDKTHIKSISTYMIDTVDFKIAQADNDIPDKEVWQHPMMMNEMKRQIEMTK
jgi:uncharacterized protein YjaG (DUF416 family)